MSDAVHDGISRRGILGLPGARVGASALEGLQPGGARKLHVVIVGAHPDDPESGCGGTMALYAAQGHSVTSLYLTRGEAGISGKSAAEAAAIRTAEAGRACEILGARPVFAGQVDGATEISRARYAEFHRLLSAQRPDLVFAHWPIDTHPDHRAASLLAYNSWLEAKGAIPLFYFEVYTGLQTQGFNPSLYIDISSAASKKRAAVYAHESQQPKTWYPHHERMDQFRGFECNCAAAEAYVEQVRRSPLPQTP